jgi:hypothetical protein
MKKTEEGRGKTQGRRLERRDQGERDGGKETEGKRETVQLTSLQCNLSDAL